MNSETMRIAKTPEDFLSASTIHAYSWKATYPAFFSKQMLDAIAEDDWVDLFTKQTQNGNRGVAIFSLNGEDVGAASFGASYDYPDPTWAKILSFYFLPHVWGQGHTQVFMAQLLAHMQQTGVQHVHLYMVQGNTRAQRFYEKCGFALTGKEVHTKVKGEPSVSVELVLHIEPATPG